MGTDLLLKSSTLFTMYGVPLPTDTQQELHQLTIHYTPLDPGF